MPVGSAGAFAVLTEAGEARITAAVPVHSTQLEAMFDDLYTARRSSRVTDLLRQAADRVNPAAAHASAPPGRPPAGGLIRRIRTGRPSVRRV